MCNDDAYFSYCNQKSSGCAGLIHYDQSTVCRCALLFAAVVVIGTATDAVLVAQREEQVLKLLQSKKAAGCEFCGQGARRGDLLEIEYTAKLEDGKVFDGSSIKVGASAG